MKFYKNLYLGAGLEKKKEKLIKKLETGRYPLTLYLLVLPGSAKNQLEFYSALMLHQKLVSERDIFVVGLASGYDDAVYMVEEITREVYEKTGNADIRGYIMAQECRDAEQRCKNAEQERRDVERVCQYAEQERRDVEREL